MNETDSNSQSSLSFLSVELQHLDAYPALKQYARTDNPLLQINNELQQLRLADQLSEFHFISALQRNRHFDYFFNYYMAQRNEKRSLDLELGWYVAQLQDDNKRLKAAEKQVEALKSENLRLKSFECYMLYKCEMINSVLEQQRFGHDRKLAVPSNLYAAAPLDITQVLESLPYTHSQLKVQMSYTELELADLRQRVINYQKEAQSAQQYLVNANLKLSAENHALHYQLAQMESLFAEQQKALSSSDGEADSSYRGAAQV